MKYTISLKKISTVLICMYLFYPSIFEAQINDLNLSSKQTNPIHVVKTGSYIGIQKGSYSVVEFGFERQWKKIKLKNSSSNALFTGFNYNLFENVLGYDLGFWHKEKVFGLTLGSTISFRSDFDEARFGFSPNIGYKILRFHIHTGYCFLTRANDFNNTNTLYVSLRYFFVNERKFKKKRKKK